jgi:hypothetical protein
MKHMQHNSEIFAIILETDACNMRFKRHIYFAAYEMEARRRVEFTGGSRAITTMD